MRSWMRPARLRFRFLLAHVVYESLTPSMLHVYARGSLLKIKDRLRARQQSGHPDGGRAPRRKWSEGGAFFGFALVSARSCPAGRRLSSVGLMSLSRHRARAGAALAPGLAKRNEITLEVTRGRVDTAPDTSIAWRFILLIRTCPCACRFAWCLRP